MKKLVTALFLIFAAAVWAGDYEDGLAARQKGDFKTAVSLFKKLATQGSPLAQHSLAFMYGNGEGVLQDYAEAVRLHTLAAEQGVAKAQYNLGVMYGHGEGVLQDYAEAVRWYKLAAAQGNSDAQFNLGVMYNTGTGVLQDYAQAHMWMNLTALSGDKDAQKARDLIAAKMTSQQIAKAQAMAKRCLASKYKDCG